MSDLKIRPSGSPQIDGMPPISVPKFLTLFLFESSLQQENVRALHERFPQEMPSPEEYFLRLEPKERLALEEFWGKENLPTLLSLADETNLQLYLTGLNHLGERLLRGSLFHDKTDAAQLVFTLIAETAQRDFPSLATHAKTEADAIVGRGPLLNRLELMGRRFFRELLDPSLFAGMFAARGAFILARGGVLRYLGPAIQRFFAAEWPAQALANAVGFAFEAPAFSLAHRSVNFFRKSPFRYGSFSHEIKGNYISFGGLHLGGLIGKGISYGAMRGLGFGFRQVGWKVFADIAANHPLLILGREIGTFSGIVIGHGAEVLADVRPFPTFDALLTDSLVTYLHFKGTDLFMGRWMNGPGKRVFDRIERWVARGESTADKVQTRISAWADGLSFLLFPQMQLGGEAGRLLGPHVSMMEVGDLVDRGLEIKGSERRRFSHRRGGVIEKFDLDKLQITPEHLMKLNYEEAALRLLNLRDILVDEKGVALNIGSLLMGLKEKGLLKFRNMRIDSAVTQGFALDNMYSRWAELAVHFRTLSEMPSYRVTQGWTRFTYASAFVRSPEGALYSRSTLEPRLRAGIFLWENRERLKLPDYSLSGGADPVSNPITEWLTENVSKKAGEEKLLSYLLGVRRQILEGLSGHTPQAVHVSTLLGVYERLSGRRIKVETRLDAVAMDLVLKNWDEWPPFLAEASNSPNHISSVPRVLLDHNGNEFPRPVVGHLLKIGTSLLQTQSHWKP